VFLCRDHLMTAIHADWYGAVYLTPNHMLDFSREEARLSFDLSTRRTSNKDWVDLWITPYDDVLQLPTDTTVPCCQGRPRRTLHVRMATGVRAPPAPWTSGAEGLDYPWQTVFAAEIVRDHVPSSVPGPSAGPLEDVVEPSAAVRATFELRLTRTHVRFGAPQHDLWWIDADVPDLGWDRGVVQFGHHSYEPAQCMFSGPRKPPCGPNTWHWDSIAFAPAVPFTIIQADRRFTDAASGGEVRFAAPAPQGAQLRFVAAGRSVEVSFDGGAAWRPVIARSYANTAPEAFLSYWVPVPAGATRALVRAEPIAPTWSRAPIPWLAHSFSIWAPG
jgi:hypothetical protein